MRVDRLITDIDREWCPFSPLITYLRGDRNKKGFSTVRTCQANPILHLKTDRICPMIFKHFRLTTFYFRIAFIRWYIYPEIQRSYIIRYSRPFIIRKIGGGDIRSFVTFVMPSGCKDQKPKYTTIVRTCIIRYPITKFRTIFLFFVLSMYYCRLGVRIN